MNLINRLLPRAEPYYGALALGLTLVLMLALTVSTWKIASDSAERDARKRFEFRVIQISDAIRGRMVDYEQVMRGAVGLFAASVSVERDEWRAYVESLRLDQNYPGIQGLGFAKHVPAPAKDAHIRSLRAEGFSNYTIRPEGERAENTPIVYLEPFRDRNLRAFGYDMFSEPVRRTAMERARDSGNTTISGKVILVQETTTDVQSGILMYRPIYRNGMEIETIEQRRNALNGYVFSPFRMNDLMRGVVGDASDVRIEIYDGATTSAENLLYDSAKARGNGTNETPPAFNLIEHLVIHNHPWQVRVTSLPFFEAGLDRDRPRAALAGGIVASAMLAVIIWLLMTLRRRAIVLANRMTAELRVSRERLGLALEGAGLALFDWNVTTGRVDLSDRWNVMLGGGTEPTATTVKELQKLVHPDDMPQLQERLRSVLSGSARFYRVEHRVRDYNGEWRWILSRARVVERDASGRAVRIAGTNADISERKEMERLKNEFIATVSHELRTPLTAIIGALGLLREQTAATLPPDAEMFLEMAEQNSERLAALINDILDLEKIESGEMELRFDALKIGPLLERAAALNAPYAEKLGVRYELKRPLPDAVVSGDESRLLQVVTNLMSNAAKFSPHGQLVTLGASVQDRMLRVTVADHGAGIPLAFQARIFEKFSQADGSDSRSKGGTGLGLSICKALIEKMDGTIGFESVPGKGTTFYFDVPLADSAKPDPRD